MGACPSGDRARYFPCAASGRWDWFAKWTSFRAATRAAEWNPFRAAAWAGEWTFIRSYVPLADAFTDVLFILDDDGEGNAVSPIVSKVYLITVEGVKAKYEVPDEEAPGVVQEDVPP